MPDTGPRHRKDMDCAINPQITPKEKFGHSMHPVRACPYPTADQTSDM